VYQLSQLSRYNYRVTKEFEQLKNDPDLESTPGPGGTLIFHDGTQYCVIGPDFISMEESSAYAKAIAMSCLHLQVEVRVNPRMGFRPLFGQSRKEGSPQTPL
jgi:hypothetical protein